MALTQLQLDYQEATGDGNLIAQVTASIHLAASNVYAEANPPANHAARAAFATKVTTGQQSLGPLIVSAVAFGSLGAASSDISVNNAVAALWNMWAGA